MTESSSRAITAKDLLVRINHRLAAKGMVAVLNHSADQAGDCHIIDISTNRMLEQGLDLETLSADSGALEVGEFLERQG